MTYWSDKNIPARRPVIMADFGESFAGALRQLLANVPLWRERARQRRALAQLDDRLLRDIGIDRTAAMEEVDKPFWR